MTLPSTLPAQLPVTTAATPASPTATAPTDTATDFLAALALASAPDQPTPDTSAPKGSTPDDAPTDRPADDVPDTAVDAAALGLVANLPTLALTLAPVAAPAPRPQSAAQSTAQSAAPTEPVAASSSSPSDPRVAPQQGDTPAKTLPTGQPSAPSDPRVASQQGDTPAKTPPGPAPAPSDPRVAPQQGDTPTKTLLKGQTPEVTTAAQQPDPTIFQQVVQQVATAPVHQTSAPAIVQAPVAGTVEHPPATAQPQLSEALAHLRTRGNGSHELTVNLHPAELGAVQVRATLHNGALTVTVACADDAARHAVVAAMPELHHALGGLGTVDLDFRGPGSHAGGNAAREQAGEQRFDQPGDQSGGGRFGRADRDPDEPPRRRAQTLIGAQTEDGLDQWM